LKKTYLSVWQKLLTPAKKETLINYNGIYNQDIPKISAIQVQTQKVL